VKIVQRKVGAKIAAQLNVVVVAIEADERKKLRIA
jgi:hypothetical protein